MKKRMIPIISMVISICISLPSFAQPTQFTLELPESTVANTFVQVPENKKVCSNDIVSTITNYMRSEIDPNFDINYFDLTKIIDPNTNKITHVSLSVKAGEYTTNMGYSINIDENGCPSSLGINGNIDYINYKVCENENIDIEALKKQAKDKFLEINPYSQDSSFKITDFEFYKFLDLGYMKAYYVFDFESTIDEMGHQRGYTLFYPIDATIVDVDYNKKKEIQNTHLHQLMSYAKYFQIKQKQS